MRKNFERFLALKITVQQKRLHQQLSVEKGVIPTKTRQQYNNK